MVQLTLISGYYIVHYCVTENNDSVFDQLVVSVNNSEIPEQTLVKTWNLKMNIYYLDY